MSLVEWIVILCTIIVQCKGEFYSNVDKIRTMVSLEKDLVQIFNSSLEIMLFEYETYARFIERVHVEHALAEKNIEKYLSNPINAYKLIKRMAQDWMFLKTNLVELKGKIELQAEMQPYHEKNLLPTQKDISGAARGILRMQDYNDLKSIDLANGIINGTDYGDPLDWNICYEIGKESFNLNDLMNAKKWFNIALDKIEEHILKVSSEIRDEDMEYKLNILEYLGMINYGMGLNAEADIYFDAILDIYPEHPVKETKYYIHINPESNITKHEEKYSDDLLKKQYRLCKGIKESPEHNLKCKLSTKNNAYFILAPLKMEILKSDPEVVLYHQILTDKQIEDILAQSAQHEFFRSEVIGNIITEIRVSQQVWLNYSWPITSQIRDTVSKITGLNMANTELLQVASYGVGGQYDFHVDNIKPEYDLYEQKHKGDRIATHMFYLSDVEEGGFTVFPEIDIYSRPIKGALIVWHNLLRSLDGDKRTLHAGCPVLKGVKRISNMWVRTVSEEFSRPCDIDPKSAFIGY